MAEKEDDKAAAEVVKLTEKVTALEADLATRTEELAASGLKIDELRAERDALKRSLTAQKGATTKVRGAIEEMKAAARPRPFGRIDNTLSPAELLELIDAAETVDIAFSDGRAEIKGIPPQRVSGDAWRTIAAGLKLEGVPLTVRGPAPGGTPYPLAGYALLLDGEQVAWGERGSQSGIGPGMTYNMADDVVFQRAPEKPAEDASGA